MTSQPSPSRTMDSSSIQTQNFRSQTNNPIITSPYIKTTNQLHIKWAKILSNEQRPIIGINWQGNPNGEKTTGLRGRSLALETFSPIAKNHQISLLSLQKGYGSEQLATCSFKDRFVAAGANQRNLEFLETAAIISNCDLSSHAIPQ